MIPKVIHYCWFGGKEKNADVKRYIASWKKYCPDYKIKEWNEANFDINENDYCREAYKAKKWAFVADYVRLKVLYEEGGIYMDTDVEVLKSLDPLLVYDAVSGYESETRIPTGTIGAQPKNEWIGMLLQDYKHRHFFKDGKIDLTTNVEVITALTIKKYQVQLNGKQTLLGRNMILLPFDYLCAKSLDTGEILQTGNTYTIHHFSGSWLPESVRNYSKLYKKYDSYYKNHGMHRVLSHYFSRILAAYEIGGIAMLFRWFILEKLKDCISKKSGGRDEAFIVLSYFDNIPFDGFLSKEATA